MLKSKMVTATIATSLFTVMLSTGVFAAEATLDVKQILNSEGDEAIFTYHFSDGYRMDENVKIIDLDDVDYSYDLEERTLYVPEGSAIVIEYPKNKYLASDPSENMDPQTYAIYNSIWVRGTRDIVDSYGDWMPDTDVLLPNLDPKTFSTDGYVTQSEKVILTSGQRINFSGDWRNEMGDIDTTYSVVIDPKAPKVDASNFVFTPSNKTSGTSNNKTTTTTNTNKTTTTTTTTNTNKTTTTNKKATTPTYSVTVNGKKSTATPIVQKGVSFVPARDFVEKSLGGKVDYNAKKGTLTVYANKKVVTFTEGSSYYYVDGVKKSLPANSKLVRKNNTLYVPVKPVCQSLGFSVGYDKASNAIVVK